MTELKLSLLGPIQITSQQRLLAKFNNNKAQALLLYLVVESGRPHKRDALMNLLWPGILVEPAQGNLNQALGYLHELIPEVQACDADANVPFLISDQQSVQINPHAAYTLDVDLFNQALGREVSQNAPTTDQLEEAVTLYRGPFLADFYLPDSIEFETWAANHRARLQDQALIALHNLTQHQLQQRDYTQAQQLAWQQLDIDNLREPAYRQLMTALAKSGQRSVALAQYEIYRQRLQGELGVKPAAEISELYQRIQADELQQTVLRRPPQLPPDTATINPIFCYTDIENSTRLWDEHREAMLVALLQHNDLVESEINHFDGRILHPTGDGFLIVFEQNDPLQFAIALQKQFAQADWGEIGGLRIRIGLHGATADQEGHDFFREGEWYRGSVLNHAARIADTGHGGQIVASAMVKEYCPLPPGASWQDLGKHGLKSLDEIQHIYGLLHPDLSSKSFPALRTPANKKADQADDHIRGYDLGQKIGQGAFGEVYRAVQPGVGRQVAVKIIRSRYANQPEFIRRFEAEAQVVARLEHPHIVPLYDYWREADGAYLVMRYMRGGSVKTLLEAGELDFLSALAYIDQVAAALTFAHHQGYVHRDIKPANILLDEAGNAYLSDFGIVKDLSGKSQRTETGAVVGTPAYFSPEQALSQPVTALSDQYSLAVTLYEMLTGARPFDDTSPAGLIIKQINDPLPFVRSSRPEIPSAVDECIQRATSKEPSMRFPDVPAMMRALHMAARTDGSSYLLPVGLRELGQELVNPYQGLRSFQEADALKFFGRKTLVEQLLTHFRLNPWPTASSTPPPEINRFLAIVGPSGSGKSSVVKAGLLPALRDGTVPGSENWFIVEMVPGTYPLEELEAALLRIAINPPDSLIRQLQEDERGLVRALKRVLPADESELLLLIDQFEELYTLVESDERRSHFLNSLLTALNEPGSRLRVIVTLRADFYDRPLMTPGLAELMKKCMEIVPPMTRQELEEVIVQPAVQAGVMFEAGLVATIIDEVGEQPGTLPLLQYALTELFERRQERLLTQDAYNKIGGVLGALGRRAEELYAVLDEEGEEAARQLFMRLVTLGEGNEDTRRRVLRSEVTALFEETGRVAVIEKVIAAYGRYRLLTFDHDPVTREPTVEVAHEALLREWERLRAWLDESRDDVRLQRSLAASASEWTENNHEAGFLLRGSRLDLFASWAAGTNLALTPHEFAFLQDSMAAREKRKAEEQARQQRELETAQQLAQEQTQRAEEQSRSARRLRLLVVGLAVILLLAIGAAWLAVSRGREAQANANLAATREAEALTEAAARATSETIADEAREAAEEQAQIAFSRELAAAAVNNMDKDPERSVLLALEAMGAAYTQEAEEALHLSVPNLRVLQTMVGHEDAVNDLAYSPDGSRLVTVSDDHTARVWDTTSGQELFLLAGHEDWVGRVAYSMDGLLVATASADGTAKVWDAATGELLHTLSGHLDNTNLAYPEEPNWVNTVAFSPDSKIVATGAQDGLAILWDTTTGSELTRFAVFEAPISVAQVEFSPDGSWLAMWGLAESYQNHEIRIVDVDSGSEVVTLAATPEQFIANFAFSPDGTKLLIGDNPDVDEAVRLWDLEKGTELARYPVGENDSLQYSPDGSLFVTNDLAGGARIWETETGNEVLKLSGHQDRVWNATFSPDGTRVATSSSDNTARIWDIGPSYELLTLQPFAGDVLTGVSSIALSPDGTQLAAGGMVGGVSIWDSSSGERLHDLQGHDEYVGGLAFSPNGTRLASGSDDTTIKIWDTTSGELLRTFTGHEAWVNNLAYSPDGKTIASVGDDKQAVIWDAETGEMIHILPLASGAWGIAYSSDGSLLATGEANRAITVWDVATGQLVQEMDEANGADDVLFTPDGSKLISGGYDGTVRIWDLKKGSLEKEIPAHQGLVWGLDISPDGSIIATASADQTARIWDIESGERLLTLEGAASPITDVEFSPDGAKLVTPGKDGLVRVDVLSADELVELAKSRLSRSLTEAECQEYLHLKACPSEE